jgi:hypothetical protein
MGGFYQLAGEVGVGVHGHEAVVPRRPHEHAKTHAGDGVEHRRAEERE